MKLVCYFCDGGSETQHFQKSVAPSYADQKSKIMTHDIYVSQLHLVHQTQYFIEWVGYRLFKLQIKILQGQNSSKNTLTAMEIGFAPPQPRRPSYVNKNI